MECMAFSVSNVTSRMISLTVACSNKTVGLDCIGCICICVFSLMNSVNNIKVADKRVLLKALAH